jgi:hypothetical protein
MKLRITYVGMSTRKLVVRLSAEYLKHHDVSPLLDRLEQLAESHQGEVSVARDLKDGLGLKTLVSFHIPLFGKSAVDLGAQIIDGIKAAGREEDVLIFLEEQCKPD